MKAYLFPGQASQFEGMGKDMYNESEVAKKYFEQANDILGYCITDVMFEGTTEELQQTKITQPAVFLHSVIKAKMLGNTFQPDAVAGHSLGELSALVAAKSLTFEDGLKLVEKRALAMQMACEQTEGTMAAIIGLSDMLIENVCDKIPEIVVPANYNCPGQLVISGSISGINQATKELKESGAKRAIVLAVGGAFHSPLMEPAKDELQAAIETTIFSSPICPIYQNVNGIAAANPDIIKQNLIAQLTSPVLWTKTIQNMIEAGIFSFVEVGGNGKVLRGFVRKIDRELTTEAA